MTIMLTRIGKIPLGWTKSLTGSLLLIILLAPQVNRAAEVTGNRFENITGSVKNQEGEPLAGVTVTIQGTKTATVTNDEGVFRINLPTGNEVLLIHYLGYKTQEVAVGGRTTLAVVMEQDASGLAEVIVTGYGEKKRSEIVGSIATITGEELEDIPAPNIAAALRNRIAGVSVGQNSGRPGADITLNIRNSTTSPRGNIIGATAEPLYIIDGITVGGRDFDNLDPSMVEEITILKDAAAAIYGAAGAKGVVLITTKRGKQGKPSISYNGYLGVSDAATPVDMMSGYEHAMLLNDAYLISNAAPNSFFSEEDLEYIKNLDMPTWYDQLWKPALTQRHNLSVSGGSEKITFFVGGSYQNENANYAGMKIDKYSFRSGLTAQITNSLKADINFSTGHNIDYSTNGLDQRDNAFFENIVTMPRWVPLMIDGKYVSVNGTRSHPLGLIESGNYNSRKNQNYRINASISFAPQNFLKGLTARLQVSQGASNGSSTAFRPNYQVHQFVRFGNNAQFYSDEPHPTTPVMDVYAGSNARYQPSLSRGSSYQGFFTLNYAKTFGSHSVGATVGGEQSENNSESLGATWTTQEILNIDEYWAFDQNSFQLNGRSLGESVKRSFFGRFSYDFQKKYLLEAVARYDASSNFAKGNIWGLSPSIGGAWLVSEENFFKDNVPLINYLKLKVNYGIAGDDRVAQRIWQERYRISLNSGYVYGDSWGIGLNPDAYPNPSITWEKKQTFNAGVELSMFDNKLDLGMEFFRNKTYDGFDGGLNDLVPMYAGFASPTVNYRVAYNWGSEFTIGYRATLAREWQVSANINFGFGNSVVDRMLYNPNQLWRNTAEEWLIGFGTDPRRYSTSNIGLISKGMFRTQAEVDAFLLENPSYVIDGKVPQVGWLYFEDQNGDGVINNNDMVPMYDRIDPLLNAGLTLGVKYKSFSLSTNIFARIGGRVFYDSNAMSRPEPGTNVPGFWRDRWTPDNPNGRFPRFDDAATVRRWNSDFWTADGTTVRVNNMTLSYSVPSELANRLGLVNVRLMATGNNLWTLVNPYGYKDPYSNYIYDYPILRTLSFGINIGI